MILKGFMALGASMATAGAAAQAPAAPAPAVRAAMEKVAWLVGEWEGEGWRAGPDGVVETFKVRERVEPKLGGLILLIEGRGWSDGADGAAIEGHHAIGVFSYDAYAQQYHFDAFVKEGYQTRATPEISEHYYAWSHPAGPSAEMRYAAELSEDGAWRETGSYCRGDDCRQTFEMRLTRINVAPRDSEFSK